MKTRKRKSNVKLEDAIMGGQGEGKRSVGRPPLKNAKRRCHYYLDEVIADAIENHAQGNKSFFVETAIREYLAKKGIELE